MFILPLLPLLYVGLAVGLSWLVMRWIERRSGRYKRLKRWSAGAGTFVILLLLPTWNIIAARLYMTYLCAKEGGIEVYREVEIPKRYFSQGAYPSPERKFVRGDDEVIEYHCFDDDCYQLTYERTLVANVPPESRVTRLETQYFDPGSGEVIGKAVSFAHTTWYSLESSAAVCPRSSNEIILIDKVFAPSSKN